MVKSLLSTGNWGVTLLAVETWLKDNQVAGKISRLYNMLYVCVVFVLSVVSSKNVGSETDGHRS